MTTHIAICLPSRGECKAGFTYDLAKLAEYTARKMPDVEITWLSGSGTLIHELRRQLAHDAVDSGADWVLFLDDDMRFPHDALERLLKHRRDIVGCNYTTRTMPLKPTAKLCISGTWHNVPTSAQDTGLAEVDGLGFGCILINARVFKALDEPWFSMPWAPGNKMHVGEDVFFVAIAQRAGFHAFVDNDLSKEIKHCGAFEFSWDHYEALRDA